MKHKINKIAAIFIVSIFALSGVGVAYAAWTDTITIKGTATTGTMKWEFSGIPTQGDSGLDPNCFWDLETGDWVQMDKDVANTVVEYEQKTHPHKMTVTINNAYPYYANHIGFKVHCYGNIPLRVWKVNFVVKGQIIKTLYDNDWYSNPYVYLDLNGDGAYDLEIWWGNPLDLQMHFCGTVDRSFEILVLQPAPQGKALKFTIEYVAIQWNEWTPEAP